MFRPLLGVIPVMTWLNGGHARVDADILEAL
jgi:hypothetical protein